MFSFWLEKKYIERPRLLICLLLAPLSTVLVLPVFGLVSGGSFSFPNGVMEEFGQELLMVVYYVYPIGLLGCMFVCLPLYFLQRWLSFHYGVSYLAAGFLGGAFLFWFLFILAVGIWSLEFWSSTEFGQIAETFAEALTMAAPKMGFFGAITGATFFWLLIRTDRRA